MGMRRTKQALTKLLLHLSNTKIRVNKFILKNIFRQFNTYLFRDIHKKVGSYNISALKSDHAGLCKGHFQGVDYLIHFLPGDHIESNIYLNGVHEKKIADLVSLFLRPVQDKGVVIDIGANIGASTIPHALMHNNIKFYCYEPHPDVFDRLERNIKLNNLHNVVASNCAVSDSSQESIAFYAQKISSNMGKSSLKPNKDIEQFNKVEVPVQSIDDVFVDSGKRIVLIKIDTQGTEPEILRSCRRVIEKFRPVVIFEFEDRYYSDQEKVEEKIFLNMFFKENDYLLLNISEDINYYPGIDITKNYHGDILAIPN